MTEPAAHDVTSPRDGPFVAVSEIDVPFAGRAALDAAFAARLRAVDRWPGFRGLQVWASEENPESLMMVSWRDDESCFAACMGSPDHRRSHRRVPTGRSRPRARAFRRFTVIAR